MQNSTTKIVWVAASGAIFECYDFMICAFMSGYLISIFFSGNSLLGVFAIYTVGFFSRPLGGIFWGHFGDRYGRKKVFSLTMLLLVVPTLLIAVYPTNLYPSLNGLAFMVLRFLQGFLVGGEFAGGVTFIAEIAPLNKRGQLVAIFMSALTGGLLLSSLVSLLLSNYLSSSAILAWGWRLPFGLSIFLVVIAAYLRSRVGETSLFESLSQRQLLSRLPLFELFKNYPLKVLYGFILSSCSALGITTLYTFLPQLMKLNGVFSPKQVLDLTTYGSLVLCLSMPFCGYLSDKIGRKRIFIASMLLTTSMLLWFYLAIKWADYRLLMLAMLVSSLAFSGLSANYCTIISELFPTSLRFSGVAVSYTLGYSVWGGVLPLLYLHFANLSRQFLLPLAIFSLLSCLLWLIMLQIEDRHGQLLTS